MDGYLKAAETLKKIKVSLEKVFKTMEPGADFTDAFDAADEALRMASGSSDNKPETGYESRNMINVAARSDKPCFVRVKNIAAVQTSPEIYGRYKMEILLMYSGTVEVWYDTKEECREIMDNILNAIDRG